MGRSTVEREGVSVSHASRIVLIGTMNPEEGELRPQLLDRFGLTVEVAAPRDPALRAEVIRRRMAFDRDPDAFSRGVRGRRGGARRRGIAAARAAAARRSAGRRAAADHRQDLRRVRGGRDAGRHRHRPGRRRPRGLARPGRGDHRGHPGRRPAGPAAPPPAQPVRRPRPGRGPARPAARRARAEPRPEPTWATDRTTAPDGPAPTLRRRHLIPPTCQRSSRL